MRGGAKNKFLSKMKQIYTSPAIETTEVLVEAGIAMSEVALFQNGFGLTDEKTTYEEETFMW